eukprot:403336751
MLSLETQRPLVTATQMNTDESHLMRTVAEDTQGAIMKRSHEQSSDMFKFNHENDFTDQMQQLKRKKKNKKSSQLQTPGGTGKTQPGTQDDFVFSPDTLGNRPIISEESCESMSPDKSTLTMSMISLRSMSSGWDYITFPKRANVENIPKPQSRIKEDYYERVKLMRYHVSTRIIGLGFFLSLATLLFALLSVLIFNWKAYSAIFVIGLGNQNQSVIQLLIDIVFTCGFIIFLIVERRFFNNMKIKEEQECALEEKRDQEKQVQEKQDYEERVKMEFMYTDFVNSIRSMSREIMATLDPDFSMQRFYQRLEEIRDTLFTDGEFCTRFIKEELKTSATYDNGSQSRKLIVIRELFAIHITMYWMSIKQASLETEIQNDQHQNDERDKLQSIQSCVKSLTENSNLLFRLAQLLNQTNSDTSKNEKFSIDSLDELLNQFENDNNSEDDKERLKKIQKIYRRLELNYRRRAEDRMNTNRTSGKTPQIVIMNMDTPKMKKQKTMDPLMQFSPDKRTIQKERLLKPIGDLKEYIFNMMMFNEQSSTDLNDYKDTNDNQRLGSDEENQMQFDNEQDALLTGAGLDEDFQEFENLLGLPDSEWELGFKNDYIKVWKETGFNNKPEIMVKCEAILPKIPMHIPFEALADIDVRKKWDEVLWNLTVIEDGMNGNPCVFYYNIRAPSFMQSREVIVSSKMQTDFIKKGNLALHHKTIDHPDYPEDPSKFIRIHQKINAFMFEECAEYHGTKVTWIVSQKVKTNTPLQLLHQRAVRNPKIMIDSLIKACHKIQNGDI